jgi:hypothetical protein
MAAVMFGLFLSLLFSSFAPTSVSAATSTEPAHTVTGKVSALTNASFTLKFATSNTPATFKVTSDSQFFRDGKPAKFSDMQVGMEISALVQYNPQVKMYVAMRVTLPPAPKCNEYTSGLLTGKVYAKNNDSFMVVWQNGEVSKTPFMVTPNTQFFSNDKPASFADLKVGQTINFIVRTCGDGKYTALKVNILAAPKCDEYTSGLLTAKVYVKNNDSFVVIWQNGEVSKTPIMVTSATQFTRDGKPASFADLKVGQTINFVVQTCGDGKYTAVKVQLPSASDKNK